MRSFVLWTTSHPKADRARLQYPNADDAHSAVRDPIDLGPARGTRAHRGRCERPLTHVNRRRAVMSTSDGLSVDPSPTRGVWLSYPPSLAACATVFVRRTWT